MAPDPYADSSIRTNAKNAADEHARDSRIDAVEDAPISAADFLRRHHRRTTDAERAETLRRRCLTAARIELRGDAFSPEDRLDVAAEVLAAILSDFSTVRSETARRAAGSILILPDPDDRRVSLTACCGKVRNIRRSMIADRERDHAEHLRRSAERGPDGMTAAERDAIERREIKLMHSRDAAEIESRRLAVALDCNPAGPVADVFYQWLRSAAGPVCAAERGYTAGSWRVRVSDGGKLLRAALPSALALLHAVLPEDAGIIDADGELTYCQSDDSREAHSRTRMLADAGAVTGARQVLTREGVAYAPLSETNGANWREGTADGKRPDRPADADAARAVCNVTYVRAAPRAAETRRTRAHRSARVKYADGITRTEDRSETARRGKALTAIGRIYARESRRERSIDPPAARAA